MNELPGFPFFTLVFICIFPASQMESFVSMGSELSFLGVVFLIDLDLFFSCFVPCPCPLGGGFPVVYFLGGVFSDPATETTSEVMAPELFLSGLACLSWLVATLVFGSLKSFSATAPIIVFISWISTLISFTSWATTSDFVVAFVSHI